MTEHSLARPRPSRVDRALLWVRGARPRTLFISLAPILVGFAQASTLTDNLAVLPVFAAAIAALAIQIATNLANDAADGARGGDGPGRLGPERLTGAGLMPAATVAAGALAATLVAVLFGAVAIWHGGWPILAIGVAALLAGWGYSYGPRPISASPLGEVFVVLFFGVAAVVGTVWLGAGRVDATTLVLGVAIGLPAAAVLTANNHRDRIEDARNGRRTLAILIGEKRTVALYSGQLLAACLIAAAALAPMTIAGAAIVAAGAAPALWLGRRFAATPVGRSVSLRLADTARFQAALALAIAFALWARP